MIYDNLLNEAQCNNIYVIENADFSSRADGLINGNVIGLNRQIRSLRKRSCVLAEELGHYHTSTGDILDLDNVSNRKQEYHARIWAYDKLIGLTGIISSYEVGCKNAYEMADHLGVTEAFLLEALSCYRVKYGPRTKLDNYVIYFEPNLGVLELI